MNTSKIIGCILILVGTCIGAGILALPLVSAAAGFTMSALLATGIWILMTVTALLVLEINLTFPNDSNSLGVMAKKILGRSGQAVTWITLLLLLYSVLAAYTSGASALFHSMFHLVGNINFPNWGSALLFVGILGGAVFWSTKTVDYTNRFLMVFKGLFLIASIALLMPYVDLPKIMPHQEIHHSKYLGAAAPIFLTAFTFHMLIPSLRNYLKNDNRKELWLIVICGTTIPFILYLLWLIANLGTVPLLGEVNSFTAIKRANTSVEGLVGAISAIVNNKLVTTAIGGFSNISMATSFLGVGLGLFDFLADGFKRSNTRFGRLQTSLLTFIPPLIFALYYPEGFVIALGYAAIFIAILLVILPAIMAYSLRQTGKVKLDTNINKILFNKMLLIGIIVIATILIALQILGSLNLLPT